MSQFCNDRDLLGIEPVIFLSGGAPCQELVVGSDGVIASTTFSSAASDFTAAGIAAGMVLCIYTNSPAEGRVVEVVSVDSATSLTVSVLRGDATADATPPAAGSALMFRIRTFGPQISIASDELAEKLRMLSEAEGIGDAEFVDSAQLTAACAYGALAAIFVARSENAASDDANWIKAEHYRSEFKRRQLQLRLAVDANGDGHAERTRTLGSVTLRRA